MKPLTKDDLFAHDIGLIVKCDDWEKTGDQILENQEKAEKWDDLSNPTSERYSEILNGLSGVAGNNHKIVERVKEYKAQLELLLRLNDKVEDTSKLTIVGLAAVRDTINGLQKCMVGKK